MALQSGVLWEENAEVGEEGAAGGTTGAVKEGGVNANKQGLKKPGGDTDSETEQAEPDVSVDAESAEPVAPEGSVGSGHNG